jgi:hypothetical protein
MFVVEQTNFKISEFLKTKGEVPIVACETIWKIRHKGVNVKYIRLDNASENKAFAELENSSKWNLQLSFEFTGAMTPLRNYLVEIGFSTLWSCLRAMFDAADVPESEKYQLVREGIHHLTFLDGLIVKTIAGVKKTKFRHMYREDPKPAMPMRVWGEAGIVKVAGKVKSKLTMRGEMGMFVGYVESGSSDTYCMYLPNLNSIHETRDVQWSK